MWSPSSGEHDRESLSFQPPASSAPLNQSVMLGYGPAEWESWDRAGAARGPPLVVPMLSGVWGTGRAGLRLQMS